MHTFSAEIYVTYILRIQYAGNQAQKSLRSRATEEKSTNCSHHDVDPSIVKAA